MEQISTVRRQTASFQIRTLRIFLSLSTAICSHTSLCLGGRTLLFGFCFFIYFQSLQIFSRKNNFRKFCQRCDIFYFIAQLLLFGTTFFSVRPLFFSLFSFFFLFWVCHSWSSFKYPLSVNLI